MAKTATKRSALNARPKSPLQLAVQEAGMITGQIFAHLKNISRAYLKVGELLVRMRDGKLYERFTDIHSLKDYALKTLQIKERSLYEYMTAYEWAKKNHPEWLADGYKGRLPELRDLLDMSWIDGELKKDGVEPGKRTELKELRKKGEAGTLRRSEVNALRKKTHGPKQALKGVIAELMATRRRMSKLTSTPAQAMELISALIELLQKQEALRVAGLSFNAAVRVEYGTLFFA